jgi:hypothetical protein
MMESWLEQLRRDALSGNIPSLSGARIVADIPVSDRLIGQIIAGKIGSDSALQEVDLKAEEGRARVTVKVARPSFLPPLSAVLTVERQPDLPVSPVLVLRVGMMPGVAALLGAGISLVSVLPAGLRLEGDRLFLDVPALLSDRGYAWLLPYLRALSISFVTGRVVCHVEAGI